MRKAIYFTPADGTELAAAAARWFGRDAVNGAPAGAGGAGAPDIDPAWIAAPRRYGFHATLKAPFRLADGRSAAELDAALAAFAAAHAPFGAALRPGRMGDFFALVPAGDASALNALADAAVRAFEPFRAPLSAADIARRRPQTLSAPERAMLDAWGYPYAFETFRFHMTLTGPVPAERAALVEAEIDRIFGAALAAPAPVASVAIFEEPAPGAPFIRSAEARLTGGIGASA